MIVVQSLLEAVPVSHTGSDEQVARAALVSTGGDVSEEKISGLIRYLYTNRHTSPFEHSQATFRIKAPLFVLAQWSRHRTQSLNVKSLRFGKADPFFYVPGTGRPLVNSGSGAHPSLVHANDPALLGSTQTALADLASVAWDTYLSLLEDGVAEELARACLPTNLYTEWYATTDLWNWMRFLENRIESKKNKPQWEIQELALQIENYLHDWFPISMKHWREDFNEQI